MKRSLKVFIFLSLYGITASCSSGGNKKAETNYVVPKSGVIHEHIVGFTDKNISYALYIPTKISHQPAPGLSAKNAIPTTTQKREGKLNPPPASLRLPVMVAFDPHGSGLLPVKTYKDLAEKYGFILIGSNNSKNGLSFPEIRSILSSMFTEIHAVYPVDTTRIYMLGFSGGSRIASIAAGEYGGVKAVIGCGAGLPTGAPSMGFRFDYFGIAGTADFNMFEMLQLDEPMNQAGIRHFITTFPGPHAWPPVAVMEEGFQWLILNAMRDGTLRKDDAVISRIMAGFNQRIADAKSGNHLIAANDACKEAILFADGLAPADEFIQQSAAIEQHPEYQKQLAYRAEIMKKETEEQNLFESALLTKDLSWWKNRVSMMGRKYMKGKNPEDTLMNTRLKAFLSLYCYSYANAVLVHREYNEAGKAIAVYEVADPPNPEPNYMRAIVLAVRSENDSAIGQLQIAVSKGFTDKIRIIQQPEFQSLKSLPAWFDLIKSIQ